MVFTLFLIFCTATFIGYAVVPILYKQGVAFNQRRGQRLSRRLDRVISRQKIKKIRRFYLLAPVAAGGISYVILPPDVRLFGVVLAIMSGFFIPGVYITVLIAKNKKRFEDQLIDALMIMSSSFRGGLSLIQAMEAVVEEMSDPIDQEFSTVLAENNMGVSLEDAMNHLYNRMPSTALQQMITAILLARETGGNLPDIFKRIVSVIRERKKIQGQIDTLTLQGKIQGVVMSLLPVAFFVIIYTSNPGFFSHMFISEVGRTMLIAACFLEVIGAFLIWKVSSIKDF